MNAQRWQQVRAVIEDALDRAPEARADFLAQACAGDDELRREAEQYLRCEAAADVALPVSHWSEQPPEEAPEVPDPERIGVYRILRRLGEGGMGVVYLAERDDGEFRQQVALKVLKPGGQQARLLRLFRLERQILAQLQHPNVAQILDGGSSGGQIYYAMEYVDGVPLTDYCRNRGLSVRQRLELFRRVCEAVSHAHRRLIIHRDLKPGNILVTPDGVPKLLDFGLAKILHEGAAGEQPSISMGPMMTPAYASPEQIRGEPLSTATDVFSLGVVLYELLAGTNPHMRGEQSPVEVCRTICDAEPQPPSRYAESELRRQLSGDLDNIVLMALRKEPERRYGTVDELRRDIERYLDGFPVSASRGTAYYRSRKFVTRHRWGLAIAALFAVAGVGATGVIWWEGRAAEMRFQTARRLAHAVVFELNDAVEDLPGSTQARRKLIGRALEYLKDLEVTAGGRRDLRLEMAAAYMKIGEVEGDPGGANIGNTRVAIESEQHARRLVKEVLRSSPGDSQAGDILAGADERLANLQQWHEDPRAWLELWREATDLRWQEAARHPQELRYRAAALANEAHRAFVQQDWPGAVAGWRQALAAYSQAAAREPGDPDLKLHIARCYRRLAEACQRTGDLPSAIEAFRAAERLDLERVSASPGSMSAQMELSFDLLEGAWVEHELGRHGQAIADLEQALAIQKRVSEADPLDVWSRLEYAKLLNTAAPVYSEAGRRAKAIAYLKEAADRLEAELAHDPANDNTRFHVGWVWSNLGDMYLGFYEPVGANPHARPDWRKAADCFERAQRFLSELNLKGDIEEFDPRQVVDHVASSLAECRAHAPNRQ